MRLASRLTEWNIDIITDAEFEKRQKADDLELAEVADANNVSTNDLSGKNVAATNSEYNDNVESKS